MSCSRACSNCQEHCRQALPLLMASFHGLARRARAVAASPEQSVPSPCVSVCHMDAGTGWCEGCLRTLPEIVGWGQMDDQDKRRVWSLIAERIEMS